MSKVHGLVVSLGIAALFITGMAVRIVQLSGENYMLRKSYLAVQAQLAATQTQNNQPSCQYYLDFLHNGQPCPYNQ